MPRTPVKSVLAPGERLLPTFAAVAAASVLGDFLLWGFEPGLSLAIFFGALALMLLLKNVRAAAVPRVLIPFGLLLVSAVQTAIEVSFTNLAVIVALFAVFIGELYFTTLPAGWARWSESFIAWFAAPGRWIWCVEAIMAQPARQGGTAVRLGDRLGRWALIGLPAIALLALFGVVFAAGNRIFSDYLSRFGKHFSDWLRSFDFSLPRLFFWLFLATLALALFRPRAAAQTARAWARPLREWAGTAGEPDHLGQCARDVRTLFRAAIPQRRGLGVPA
jgi:hypothetical protein